MASNGVNDLLSVNNEFRKMELNNIKSHDNGGDCENKNETKSERPKQRKRQKRGNLITKCLEQRPQIFLHPTRELNQAAMRLAEQYVNTLVKQVNKEQPDIQRVYTKNFNADQVWEQSKKVVHSVVEQCWRELQALQHDYTNSFEASSDSPVQLSISNIPKTLKTGVHNGVISSSDTDSESDQTSQVESNVFSSTSNDSYQSNSESESDENGDDSMGLNDGFFHLDEFNRQTLSLEQQDRKLSDASSDNDDDIDWTQDPLNFHPSMPEVGRALSDNSYVDDEDDGPTFGNMDLYAPEGDSDVEVGDTEGDLSHENYMYEDFFAPPIQRKRNTNDKKAQKSQGKPINEWVTGGTPSNAQTAQTELNQAMEIVRRDLFSDANNCEDDTGDIKARASSDVHSTHEQRQARLVKVIRKLEEEAINERYWAMKGELSGASRPQNCLLEEDVDFEHTGKPLPIITPEVNEGIESMIKRRIVNREFDEVIRRYGDAHTILGSMDDKRGSRSDANGALDVKPTQSLAQIYEEAYRREHDAAYIDTASAALKAQHAEIREAWNELNLRLGELSTHTLHVRRSNIPVAEIRVNVPSVVHEDAQPTIPNADLLTTTTTTLAPQEIYRPGTASRSAIRALAKVRASQQSEVDEDVDADGDIAAAAVAPRQLRADLLSTKGGMPVSRAELTSRQLRQRHRRAKLRAKARRARPSLNPSKRSSSPSSSASILKRLADFNTRIIDEHGVLRDISGRPLSQSCRKVPIETTKWKL